MRKVICVLVCCLCLPLGTMAQTRQDAWVDSIMCELSLEQKIAQLMVVRVPTKMTHKERRNFERLLTRVEVGGVCFFAGTAQNQLEQTIKYQRLSNTPLWVCIDAEWGLGMRLTDCYSFPKQMMLGALPDHADTLIYQMGQQIALQCAHLGVHVNFAPVVDLNSNPSNPVIGSRSFGMNKLRASRKAAQYSRALQDQHILPTAKHFPGHGDTDVDSHLDLPVINHSRQQIDSVDSYPFRHLAAGIRGMMIAHLQVPALDTTAHLPASLSPRMVGQPKGTPHTAQLKAMGAYQGYLRNEVNFNGIVFTDGMDMKGVTKHYTKGLAELMALYAGADVILLPPDVEAAVQAIKVAAEADSAFAQVIESKCRRVLAEKYRCGLAHLHTSHLRVPSQREVAQCRAITQEIAFHAATLVRNDHHVLPLHSQEQVLRLAVGYGDSTLKSLTPELLIEIERADKVLISCYYNTEATRRLDYGLTAATKMLIDTVCAHNPHTALVLYGSPFALKYWPREGEAPAPQGIVVAYQNMPEVREALQLLLWGEGEFEGVLPVAVAGYPEGYRYQAPAPVPSNPYALLKEYGMNERYFHQIDSVVQHGIVAHAYPGCQVLVAKDGKVVYNRCYGHYTYAPDAPVVDSATLYDIASLTKVAATTFAIMKLVDEKKIHLDDKLSRYLPYLKHSNKSKITIRQTLSHFARLKAFDAYWKQVDDACMNCSVAAGEPCEGCKEQVLKQITASPLGPRNKYVYSDLGFILLADLVEQVSGQRIDVFVQQHFYEPMGLHNTTFQPLLHGVPRERIAPTENHPDKRQRLLQGEVHDPNAAAMGGVAGHAGLFSTATDLSKLYIMMLNGGEYEGRRYLSEEVLQTFNTQYYKKEGNRRSLGYDKPLPVPHSNTAREVSQSSFGHTGFTGTMIWADPAEGLVYIFLSNRVHPDSKENKLASMNIRTQVQSLIYQSLRQ